MGLFKKKKKNKEKIVLYQENPDRGKTQQLVDAMERTRLYEYAMYVHRPLRLLAMNFLIGLARGLGSTVGLALVLGIIIVILQQVITWNLPGISAWLAELIANVKAYTYR